MCILIDGYSQYISCTGNFLGIFTNLQISGIWCNFTCIYPNQLFLLSSKYSKFNITQGNPKALILLIKCFHAHLCIFECVINSFTEYEACSSFDYGFSTWCRPTHHNFLGFSIYLFSCFFLLHGSFVWNGGITN